MFGLFRRGRSVEQLVVDDRVLILGLDGFVRTVLREHEEGELLHCAARVAQTLELHVADVTVEGHYSETPRRARYFLLMRALQGAPEAREREVARLPEFQRLLAVASSPIFGRAMRDGKLLPLGHDPLSEALGSTAWSVDSLVGAARAIALRDGDVSLVGLAAQFGGPVALAAVRESVVLYARSIPIGIPTQYEYVWQVSPQLEAGARRFVELFRGLFGDSLPFPTAEHAEGYYRAHMANDIEGRCVRLGSDHQKHYHWGIVRNGAEFVVRDFWARDVWSTERFRVQPPP